MNKIKWAWNEYVTYLLLTLVFLSSWTDINGIFTELPQIALSQPEQWKLGAYIGLITNFGNISPMILVLIKFLHKKSNMNPVPINYFIIIIGMFSCLLLSLFWDYTATINEKQYSLALLILVFSLSLLDCTSSVSFADYIQKYRKEYTSTLFLGESLTLIVPSLLAIIQGNGELTCIKTKINETIVTEPKYKTARFSVSIYFLCLFVILTISFLSFFILQWTSISRKSRQCSLEKTIETNNIENETMDPFINLNSIQVAPSYFLTKSSYFLLSLGCVYISSILFGILFAISTYVLMPYGHTTFYNGMILSPWVLTFIWLIGIVKPLISKRYIFVLILLGSITFSFVLFIALKSPCPPFSNAAYGEIFVLTLWLITYFLLGYPRLIIANYVRNYSPNSMFWFGAQVQLGALIGSIIAYLFVETFSIFSERKACETIIC